jgi:hypothetical protein
MKAFWISALLLSLPAAGQDGMYKVQVSDVRIRPIDEKGEPAGNWTPLHFEQNGTVACRLDRNPGKKPLNVWFKGTTDANGKLRALGSGEFSQQMPSRGGTSDDAATCAFSAYTNSVRALEPQVHLEVRVRAKFQPHT